MTTHKRVFTLVGRSIVLLAILVFGHAFVSTYVGSAAGTSSIFGILGGALIFRIYQRQKPKQNRKQKRLPTR